VPISFPSRVRVILRRSCLAILVTLVSVTSIEAQRPLRVTPKKDLQFGVLFPGVATTVLPTSVTGAGVIDITGPNNNQIQITFTLPTSLAVLPARCYP
jgi:hypothetical protein